MRELLSAYGRPFVRWLLACAALVVVSLIGAGEAGLIGAFLVGCLAAAVCAWILVCRTWMSSELDIVRAKKHMWIGMVLRLVTMFLVFLIAIQISVHVFWAVVSGFMLFSLLAMIHLVLFNYSQADKK